ncbi:hypothetical protein C6981_25595 [Escherichia coli]|nr:hypothetical protein C6981_25595 [Escherichia coli]
MVRKGCNSLVRAEKILTHIAWVGMASYMELLNKFQYPKSGNDSNLLIVFYVQIMPDDFVMQLHRF